MCSDFQSPAPYRAPNIIHVLHIGCKNSNTPECSVLSAQCYALCFGGSKLGKKYRVSEYNSKIYLCFAILYANHRKLHLTCSIFCLTFFKNELHKEWTMHLIHANSAILNPTFCCACNIRGDSKNLTSQYCVSLQTHLLMHLIHFAQREYSFEKCRKMLWSERKRSHRFGRWSAGIKNWIPPSLETNHILKKIWKLIISVKYSNPNSDRGIPTRGSYKEDAHSFMFEKGITRHHCLRNQEKFILMEMT